MRKNIDAGELARDSRFERRSAVERVSDIRNFNTETRRMDSQAIDLEERARRQMHGIPLRDLGA